MKTAFTHGPWCFVSKITANENHLIAAAPELLEALRNIANADTVAWDDKTEYEAWAKNRARAAIAKAVQA